MVLSDLLPGEDGVVRDLTASGALGQRLIDLGFYPGVGVTVVRNAPFIDPVEINLEGAHISLRHEEADCVEVEKL